MTVTVRVVVFALGIASSVLLARGLGPENKGTYAIAMLLPTMIVAMSNLGFGHAAAYFIAKREHASRDVLGSNLSLGLVVSVIGALAGLAVVYGFQDLAFSGIPRGLLFLGLTSVPVSILILYTSYVLLGEQRLRQYNYVGLINAALFPLCLLFALRIFKSGVGGAILATLTAQAVAGIVGFRKARRAAGGIAWKPLWPYIRSATRYGLKSHLSNVLDFLTYRFDLFLVGSFLNPAATGFYSLSVGIAEKLWLVSTSAAIVILPRIAGETDADKRKRFTPLVARTVLWLTCAASLLLIGISPLVVRVLYSEAYLPSVASLRVLVVGIALFSPSYVLANDLAARGRPDLNCYVGLVSFAANLLLDVLWIPRWGIAGAAWATTGAYTASLIMRVGLYTRVSGNAWQRVLILQKGDWRIYQHTIAALIKRLIRR